MVSIGERSSARRSALDYSLVACLASVFLLALILVDAYEYVTVPGAKHARHHIHKSADTMAALMEQLTKREREEMLRDVEDAEATVRKKRDEVEEIVEKVEEMEKEVREGASSSAAAVEDGTDEEKALEEEKKEEVVEAMVEKELGLEKWCGGCKWLNMGFTCDKRVSYLMEKYGVTEVAAKEANIEHCSNRRLLRGY